MDTFTDAERDYLAGQPLGRLATLQPNGTLQNSPVGFRLNDDGTIDIYGRDLPGSQKWRNVARHPQVAFVVDDLASTNPWRPRCLEIRGTAAQVQTDGGPLPGVGGEAIRITPKQLVSFGINEGDSVAVNRRV